MKRRTSMRFRLTAWYLIALTSGLVLFAGAIWFSMRHSLLKETNRALVDRTHKLSVFLNRELAADPAEDLREELDEYARVLPAGVVLQIREQWRCLFRVHGGFPFSRRRCEKSASLP